MHAISTDALKGLLELTQAPCLSLYQATHRNQPDNAQDRMEFRRGVEVLNQALMADAAAHDTQKLLDPFHHLAEDAHFWEHTLDGLADFSSLWASGRLCCRKACPLWPGWVRLFTPRHCGACCNRWTVTKSCV